MPEHPAENESVAHAGPGVSVLAFLAHLKGTVLRCSALQSDGRISPQVRLAPSHGSLRLGNLVLLSESLQSSEVTEPANLQQLIDSSGGRPVVSWM